MTVEMDARALDVDLLARELGNWRTSSRSGPAYYGLADAIRLLLVDGRIPVGARLPSERAMADTLRVSRTTVTAAYAQLREDGYLNARRGARSTTALPVAPAARTEIASPSMSLAAAALSAPAAAVSEAFVDAVHDVTPYLHKVGHELVGVDALREAIAESYCQRGLPTAPDQVLVTTGALHAINLILTTYVQPGDRVLVEQPTYHGALTSIATAGARPVPVAMTENGWELDAIAGRGATVVAEPGLPDPDNQNPTGLTMPAARPKTVGGHHRRDPNPHGHRRNHPRHVARRSGAGADGGRDDDATRPGADRRLDVEVVLGRPAGRLDPRRASHHRHHRRAAPVDRHGHARSRTVRRRKASRAARRASPRATRDSPARRALLLSLLDQHLPDWEPGGGYGGMSLWVRLPAPMSTALSAAASRMGLELPAGPRFGVDGTLERFVRVPYALPEDRVDRGHRAVGPRVAQRHRLHRTGADHRRRLTFHPRADAYVPANAVKLGLFVCSSSSRRVSRPCGTFRRWRRRPRSRRG